MTVERLALIGGPPGSGKSSIANTLSGQTRLNYLSMGDHIRGILSGKIESCYQNAVNAERNTLTRSGKLPQTLVRAIIEEQFRQPKIGSDMVLDGYPRSLEQVEPFLDTLTVIGAKALVLVYLDINREEAVRRMLNRGNREGEQPIDIDIAKMRHDSYIESYGKVLTALSSEMPVCKVRANATLTDNVSSARAHLEAHFGNL